MDGKQYADAARVLVGMDRPATRVSCPHRTTISFCLLPQRAATADARDREFPRGDGSAGSDRPISQDRTSLCCRAMRRPSSPCRCNTAARRPPPCAANGWATGRWPLRIASQANSWYEEGSAVGRGRAARPAARLASPRPCSVRPGVKLPTQPVSLGGVKVAPAAVRGSGSRPACPAAGCGGRRFFRRCASPWSPPAQPVLYQATAFAQLNDSDGAVFRGTMVAGGTYTSIGLAAPDVAGRR